MAGFPVVIASTKCVYIAPDNIRMFHALLFSTLLQDVTNMKLSCVLIDDCPMIFYFTIFTSFDLSSFHPTFFNQECDLSNFSVLHVVRGSRAGRQVAALKAPRLNLEIRTEDQGLNQLLEPGQKSIPGNSKH